MGAWRKHREARTPRVVAMTLLILGAAAGGAQDVDLERSFAYLPTPGPYEVEEISGLELIDEARKKTLPLKAYVPLDAGPFPIILFSHGAGESAESAPNLARHWSSYGYVCLHPGHVQRERETRRFSLGRFFREFGRIRNLGSAPAFGQRVADLALILDHLDALADQTPALHGKMDRDRVGVAGHSLGAVTAVLIGGAKMFPPERDAAWGFRDERVNAVVSISGAGVDPDVGLPQDSWESIDVPMLVIAGSRDPGRGDVRWRTHPYVYAPEGDKYLLYIEGANHLSYIRPGTAETYAREEVARPEALPARKRFLRRNAPAFAQEAIFHYTLMATTAFWDAYIKESEEAREFLTSGALEEYSFGAAEIEAK